MPIYASDFEPWGELAKYGISGIIIGWLLFFLSRRVSAIEAALDRLSRAILLLVVTFGSKPVKEQGQAITGELDEADAKRK